MRERTIFWRRWIGALLLCAYWGYGRAETVVFTQGRALLPVIVAADAEPEERAAADELARVLEKMSGIAWTVRSENGGDERGLHVGYTRTAARLGTRLHRADDVFAERKNGETGPDGFRIRTVAGSVFVEAAAPEALEFAVGWLVKKYAGVRWYAPGHEGEVVPRRAEWALPDINEVREPAYVSREFHALGSAAEKRWGVRNGLRARLEFNHALANVVTVQDVTVHPEWAPLLKGKRYEPASPKDHHWQPDLAQPEVAAHAAKQAVAAFAREPARASFSLGINDTVRFDQGGATRALIEPLKYFRGMPDYSPLVFTFMNRAAEELAQMRTDRYLGCLAYFWCENTPPFRVHPQVIPYVTTDRSQFYDRAYRDADLALMERWGKSGVKAFGLWEYGYGQNFLVPRVPHRALIETVREGWKRGARGYFMDITPQWGFDAFKTWAVAQLLWEPERTFEELAEDFFNGYYGAAVKPMRAFFERCEAQWMAQTSAPYWLKFYQQEDQALLFSPESCRALRALLDEAERLAENDEMLKTRVGLTSRAFAVTEAYVRFDSVRRQLNSEIEGSDGGFMIQEEVLARLLGECVDTKAALKKAWREAQGRNDELPAMHGTQLDYFTRNDPVPRLLWLAGERDGAAPARLLDAVGVEAVKTAHWRLMADTALRTRLEAAPEVLLNGAFSEIADDGQEPRFLFPLFGALPAQWQVNAMPTERGKLALVPDTMDNSRQVLRCEGAWDTQVFQWRPVDAGAVCLARTRLRGQSSPGNDAGLFLTFLSADGKVVGTHRMQTLPKGTIKRWRELVLIGQAPTEAAWVGVGIGASRQGPGDWLEARSVTLRVASTEAAL